MNSWKMKAVDVRIEPTCDEHYSESLESLEVEELKWDALPNEVKESIMKKLNYEKLFQLKRVSKSIRDFIENSIPFRSSQEGSVSQEGALTSLYFHIQNGEVQWYGFDLLLKTWRPLSPLRFLPCPCRTLLCVGNGFLCVYTPWAVETGRVVVYNPLTHFKRVLPPLKFPRIPVLMHMVANATSYKVIVVGSASALGGQILSKKTEVYDSRTSQWEVTGDMPGMDFSLNKYQTGIFINKILYCIAWLKDGSGRGVVAYDMDKGKWLVNWKCPLSARLNDIPCLVQLVECDGEVYLFQEGDSTWITEHCIYKLENVTHGGGSGTWKIILRVRWRGGRVLYCQFVYVSFGEGKLSIFNTITLTGMVYDSRNGGYLGRLPRYREGHKAYHAIFNPLSFTFELNVKSTI